MTLTHRFVSASILGAMALASAPFVGAQGFGADLTDEQRQEIRASLEACREDNSDQEDRKACADAVLSNVGIDAPERGPRNRNQGRRGNREGNVNGERNRTDLPEGAKEALMTCHKDNTDHEDMKACAEAVAEELGFTLPEMGPKEMGPRMNKGRKMGHEFRLNIIETCGERANTDEWKACAKESRKGAMQEMREEHPRATHKFMMRHRFKQDLKACRDLETRDEKKACFDAVRDQLETE
ncbi:hypothetical protein COU75_04495 [Candidatus Peregrinibacteria bacterium CG10_big_fil_rev_8_21_14_0_10_42_8]|nr:MAG: hypothetical protein COU75_04495 [Candidatus Peregrinibacteria bacterium CG10_big_fil_rev_8_21_14_0_10_42_8]